MSDHSWRCCDICGRFIGFADLEAGTAIIRMKSPDSDVSMETWERLCKFHYKPQSIQPQPEARHER